MTDALTLPRLGETMEEGRIVAWCVVPGAPFRRGDVLLEVETDKTVVEVPALADGVLAEIVATDGATVKVGDVIARLVAAGTPRETEVMLTLPRLGESMEVGVLLRWLVEEGVTFARGDPLAEVETDKTVAEVPALSAGRLAERIAAEGATVAVGAPLARLVVDEAVVPSAPELATPPTTEAAAPIHVKSVSSGRPASAPVRATPLARRRARNAGLDLRQVNGTGRRGRIEARDVDLVVDSGPGAKPTQPEDGIAQAHGLTYRLTGKATGTPVALIHGFAGDHTVWAGLSAGLTHAGRRVLAVDLPGHGVTRLEVVTPEDLSAGLAPLLANTLGGGLHLVALSLGAVPAVALAEGGSAASLTLIAPAGLGMSIDRTVIEGLVHNPTVGEVGHLLDRMTDAPSPLSDQAKADIAATLGQGRLRRLAAAMLGTSGQAINLRARLARLAETMPVRIIVAHRDRILDWQEMVTVSPRIAVHHLPRAGHVAHWDAPQEVLDIVLAATADD